MYEQSRPRRSPIRFLAPLALAAIVLATYLVVEHGLNTSSTGSGSASTSTTGHHASPGPTTSRKRPKHRFYVVRSGDSLSVISARTGVPLPTLESLNPGVSTASLQVGQRLRLRR